MKHLFLLILMIGVGIGIVGCEDDDKDPPPQEEQVADPQPHRAPEKWEPDISGLWKFTQDIIDNTTTNINSNHSGHSSRILIIQQQNDEIMVERDVYPYVPNINFSPNGFVEKSYTVIWHDLYFGMDIFYSGIITEDVLTISGSNQYDWGSSVWSAEKLPDDWECPPAHNSDD